MTGTGTTLRAVVEAAGRGVPPAPDGSVTIVRQHAWRDAGVLAFTAHSVVFIDEDEDWVRAALAAVGCDPLAAALNPRFLAVFGERTGRSHDTVDVLAVAGPLPGPPPLPLTEVSGPSGPGHPRAAAARARRDGVRAWEARGGVVVLGRGVGGRLEVSVEVDEEARHQRLGGRLATAARHLAGGPVWAQVAAGNARSLRAFLAAGFRPVGAEALFTPRAAPPRAGR
ncbi:GNAT family N-acetyltransferase [Streptomyces sp. NPDC048566]|uniref:GNAT family N-acetyltransferase n=1 Tax=Streptomyces sp. NPDC048566 TaxID=3365569 RepID=UPI003711ECD0